MVEERLKKAKETIEKEVENFGLKLEKILLFGSRAKGNYKKDSDWDFLIVVNKDLSGREKRKLSANIRLKLIFQNMPSDVIIVSNKTFNERKKDVGHIIYYSIKDGIVL